MEVQRGGGGERMARRRKGESNSWLEERMGRRKEKLGRNGWLDKWGDKWGGEILSCGGRRSCQQLHSQAVNHTEGDTFREKKAERQRERRDRDWAAFISCSNPLLQGAVGKWRITWPWSDYITEQVIACIWLSYKRRKKKCRKGNIHDLINYAIMWYLFWLWYMGDILREGRWVISSMFHCLPSKCALI